MLRVLKKLHRESFEREDRGIENHTEDDNVPVRSAKLQNVAGDDLVRAPRFSQGVFFLRSHFADPVNSRADHAQGYESHTNPPRRLPGVVGRARPARGTLCEQSAEAGDDQVYAE